MASEKKIFKGFFYCKSMEILGWGQFGPQGLDLQDLWRGPLDIATYQKYISCGHHGFRGDFFKF